MTTSLLDLIAAEVAAIPVPASAISRPAPAANALGFGVDLSCITDTTLTLEEVDPNSNTAIGQAVARRLITPRGGVLDDQAYGLDLRAYCNRGLTDAQIRNIAALVRAEAMKDDRVSDADVKVTYVATMRALTIELTLTPGDRTNDVFALVFYVTSDSAQLIESIDSNG